MHKFLLPILFSASIAQATEQTVTLQGEYGEASIYNSQYFGTVFTIKDTPERYELVYSGGEPHILGSSLGLQSITLNQIYFHNENETEWNKTYSLYLYVTDEQNQVLGISSPQEIKVSKGDADILPDKVQDYTFSFSSDVNLTKDALYKVYFKGSDHAYDESGIITTQDPKFLSSHGAVIFNDSHSNEWGVMDSRGEPISGGWAYGMSITLTNGSSIPEPACAALAMLGLVGIAARRRR